MTVAYAWAPITKTEEQEDGTLMVYGPAASSDLDRDQQRLNAEWLDRAMPEWAQVGNIREQHDAKRAVGVGVGLSKADDGSHHIAAHIVDPGAVTKIKHKVLKGFSVGIKNPKVVLGKADAPGGEVIDGSICEISVVDRPCNPNTLFEIAKADGSGGLEVVEDPLVVEKTDAEAFGIPGEVYEQLPEGVRSALTSLAAAGAAVSAETVKTEATDGSGVVISSPTFLLKLDGLTATEDMIRGLVDARVAELSDVSKADTSAAGRRKAAASGAAMADGSYPIQSKSDLRKAIKAVGRGGADHDKIRKHIIKRAAALGLEAMVPNNWNSDGSLKTTAKADADPELVAKAEQLLRDVRALAPSLTKADDGDDSARDSGEHDEVQDITGADEAIACIARLIISEAESLAQGNLNEACDIAMLLDAVRSLRWFKESEEYEQQQMAATKSDTADGASTASTDNGEGNARATDQTSAPTEEQQGADDGQQADDDAPDQTEGAEADTGSESDAVTKADVAELVKAAVAEATTASEERSKALEAELAKANAAIEEFRAMPTLGGPALTRTAAQQAQAKNSDADRMRHEANALLIKAEQVSDRDLRDGYRERAKALLAKADA
ncbi:hypothetical protein ACFCYB_00095 [Streptomyces sp. NPDC056309]|uniref:hypothetical protein n=1 Tax=Streptomyces sp. NPDC056309 TaxID=3345781 RepID=UPI0035DCD8C6